MSKTSKEFIVEEAEKACLNQAIAILKGEQIPEAINKVSGSVDLKEIELGIRFYNSYSFSDSETRERLARDLVIATLKCRVACLKGRYIRAMALVIEGESLIRKVFKGRKDIGTNAQLWQKIIDVS